MKIQESQRRYLINRAQQLFERAAVTIQDRHIAKRMQVEREVLDKIGVSKIETAARKLQEQAHEINRQYIAVFETELIAIRISPVGQNSYFVKRKVDEAMGVTPEGALLTTLNALRTSTVDRLSLSNIEQDPFEILAGIEADIDAIVKAPKLIGKGGAK